jgi:hypothetical protein
MSALDQLESFLQDLLERPAWLLSSRRLQPAQLAGQLTRELEEGELRLPDRIVAPNVYTLTLAAEDYAQVEAVRGQLERQLADYIERLAAERALSLPGDPMVRIQVDPLLKARRIVAQAERPRLATREPAPSERLQFPRAERSTNEDRRAVLTVLGNNGDMRRTCQVNPPALSIGRRSDNDLALSDLKVSRHHAELREVRGEWYITDLGSTNGTRVNGEPVAGRRKLQPGDIIELGLQRLRFER